MTREDNMPPVEVFLAIDHAWKAWPFPVPQSGANRQPIEPRRPPRPRSNFSRSWRFPLFRHTKRYAGEGIPALYGSPVRPSLSGSPGRIVLCVPWFFSVDRVTVDGIAGSSEEGRIRIAPNASLVEVWGRLSPETPDLNYARAVATYRQEYQERYRRFLQTGSIR